MNIYLLRHGIATERSKTGPLKDEDRPLTPDGRRKVRCVAQAMKSLGLSFDAILTSPLLRARQTAAIVARLLGARRRPRTTPALSPHGAAADLIKLLSKLKPRVSAVLLVGHEPCLSRLVGLLTSQGGDLDIVLKKAGLCKLTTRHLRVGRCATLTWLLTPRLMKRLKKSS